MKKFLLILACIVNAWSILFQEMRSNCNAQTRSDEEIRSIALSKLGKAKTNNPSVSRRIRAASSNELKMYIENDVLSLLGFPEGGYVVVSNDERNVPVLAYSDTKFDIDSQSPGFNWWLETIQQSLEKGNTVSYASIGNGGRGPLLTTTWDQREPYNNMAPVYTQNGVEYKCVTGCVPTAMAQVVNYHKYPTVGIGQKTYDAYMSDTGTRRQLSFDYSATTFDWENMLDSYRGQYNEEQANAVATLMYACGVSIEVSYGTSGSGGTFEYVPQGLSEHFGYNAYFGVFSSTSVKTEIDNGNPILYAGGDHAFVIDGYDDDGLLHLNMGWGGSLDGYYLMSDMNGFAGGQVIFVHNPKGAAQDYFDVTIGEFSFNLYGADASACVLAYNGSNKHMVIPETVTYDGYTYVVKKIEDRSGTYHAIESISLPSTLEEIGALTFDYTNLKEIVLPEGLRSIGQQAFAGSKIEKINIPSTVESIGTFAFSFCQYLTDIEVSNDNRYFSSEGGALYDKDFQKLICLPVGIKTSFAVKEGVKIIGSGACSGTYTSEIILPQSLKRIDEEAFSNTRNLKQIIIPEGCAYVGRNAFAGGQVLSMIKIPSSVTYIGDIAFRKCTNLKEIIVDKGNQQFCSANNVLYNKNMTRLIAASPKSLSGAFNVPNTVSTISNYAFCCCNQLTYINIPSSVNNIASSAFAFCTRLETIVLPEGVTKIDAQLFWRCLSLKEVYIPSTVTSISGSAFTACNSLEKIICAANIPPFAEDETFRIHSTKVDLDDFPDSFGSDLVDFTGSLYIPETSISSYKTAQGWKDMTNVKSLSSVHALKYVVDEKVYMTNFYETNDSINLLAEPHKDGYTFSGWSEDLKTVPNHDVIISGTFIKDAEIALTDATAYTNASTQQVSKLTYTRNFKNTNWQPLYIPFSMSYEDWASQGLEVARLNGFYEYDDNLDGKVDRSALEVLKVTETEGDLMPNHPYLVRATTTGEKSIEVSDVTLYPAEQNSIDCSTMETKYTFTGTYSAISNVELTSISAYVMGGGSLGQSTSNLNPMRWYMVRESRGGQLLPVLTNIKIFVYGEDEADAIDFTYDNEAEDAVLYNVMGQKVNTNQKGLVIKNGKKYINK